MRRRARAGGPDQCGGAACGPCRQGDRRCDRPPAGSGGLPAAPRRQRSRRSPGSRDPRTPPRVREHSPRAATRSGGPNDRGAAAGRQCRQGRARHRRRHRHRPRRGAGPRRLRRARWRSAAAAPSRSRRSAPSSRPSGCDCLAVRADVREPDQVERLVTSVRERLGAIDVLVNNAGGSVQLAGRGDQRQGLAGGPPPQPRWRTGS